MNRLEKYTELKNKVDKLKQNKSRAEGALAQIKTQLKEKFGCTSLKMAKAKLVALKRKGKKVSDEFDKAVEKFEERWDELDL